MAALTLDASAAIRLALDPARNISVIEAIATADAVYAPGLYTVETANALWKYVAARRVSEEDALRMHRDTAALVDRFVDNADLFPEALTEATRLRHPVYDALYLVTARRTGSILMTFDDKLAAVARKLGLAIAGH